jgi:hypothetical protein
MSQLETLSSGDDPGDSSPRPCLHGQVGACLFCAKSSRAVVVTAPIVVGLVAPSKVKAFSMVSMVGAERSYLLSALRWWLWPRKLEQKL